jgi:hypothetical protein
MRGISVLALACAAALATPLSSYAQQVETTPVPQNAKPDFSPLAFLMGTWSCSVMSSRRPGPYQTTSTASMSPDGYWLITRTTVHKASWIPNEFSTEDRMTFDPSTSRWIDMEYDPAGGYDVSSSPGWNGNTIVWTDVTYPKTNATATNNPTTLTKMSDTRTVSVNTFTEPSGRVVTVRTTCTKT